MRGTVYTSWKDSLGVSHTDEPVAVYEDGKIFVTADGFPGTVKKGAIIGEYENGVVYTVGNKFSGYGKRLQAVAVIEDGKIYAISSNVIGGVSKTLCGGCSVGKIYSHSPKFMESSESVGLYDGDADGAAAAAAVTIFGLDSGVSPYDSGLENSVSPKSSSPTSSTHHSSGGGSVSWVVKIVLGVLLFAFFILAAIISAISFLATLAVYLLVKFIIKCVRKDDTPKSEDKKKSEYVLVLSISMTIAVIITLVAGMDGSDMLLPCIGSGIIEIIGFVYAINAVKKGKEIKLFKRFKKKNVATASVEIVNKEKSAASVYSGEMRGRFSEGDSEEAESSKSRLKSTMRTNTDDSNEGSDSFTSGGDL